MASHKRRSGSAGQGGGARRPAATTSGAKNTGTAVASRPAAKTGATGTAGANQGAVVRRANVNPNFRSRMNRPLRQARQRAQIGWGLAGVIAVGLAAWLIFSHLPAAAKKPQAAHAGATATPVACTTPKVPGLNGISTTSGGPPAVKGTVQTGAQCLQWVDIKVGTGKTVTSGSTVSVQYTGWLLNGTKFDSSYDHGGTPFQVTNVGSASVIQGWNLGLIGMKVGGERELIIPAALGYGASGYPPTIPGNATLIFTVTATSMP